MLLDDDNLLPDLNDFEQSLIFVRQSVTEAFDEADPYHGSVHAFEVEQSIVDIIAQPDVSISTKQGCIVRLAGLLHDVGYAACASHWSPDRREHVEASLRFARHVLSHISIFSSKDQLSFSVFYLIAHHDDTNYQYPSEIMDGWALLPDLWEFETPLTDFTNKLSTEELSILEYWLEILREADARAATGTDGAKRTLEYSKTRGVPLFAIGNSLNAWEWEESIIGNIRLAVKRSLIDVVSDTGKKSALDQYAQVEQLIEEICKEKGIEYLPETLPKNVQEVTDGPGFRLLRYRPWADLEAILHDIRLKGDSSLAPYRIATITPRLMSLSEMLPASYYVLEKRVADHHRLLASLQHQYALSLFDLVGMLKCQMGPDRFVISPPVVETYYEPSEDKLVSVIVDGLHRVWMAKELGIERLWVIEISDIPQEFPLVPLPLQWGYISKVVAVPKTTGKRKFRFDSLETFPDVSHLTKMPITSENFRYFFYRDLSPLGSGGVRE